MARKKTDKSDVSSQRVVNNPPTRDVNAAQRVAMALQLRASKVTYEKIAAQCGYASPGACRKAVLRELDRTIVKNVEQLRSEELNTLDLLQSGCMTLFLDEENKGRLFAADRVLAIMERRAKLLGLDIPVETAIAMNQVVIREVPVGYLVEAPQ